MLRDAGLTDALVIYQVMIKLIPDAVFLISKEERYVEINQVAIDPYGYTREELTSMGPMDLATPDERAKITSLIDTAMVNRVQFEWHHRHKNGSEITVKVIAQPIKIQGEQHVLETVRDITERKQAEEALKASEKKYRTLFEKIPDGIVVMDIQGDVTLCNQQAAKLVGFENVEDLIGRNAFDFVVPEESEKMRADMGKTLNGDIRNAEYNLVCNDDLRAIEFSGSPLYNSKSVVEGTIAVLRDITERNENVTNLRAAISGTISALALT